MPIDGDAKKRGEGRHQLNHRPYEPVNRRPTGQIVVDYLTDTLLGQPYIAPDSWIVVTVHREKTSVTLIVQHTTCNNMRFNLINGPHL